MAVRPQALDSAPPLSSDVNAPAAPRASPYGGIVLAIVSVSFASIFITWSTSPPITIALYRLALATAILAGAVLVRALLRGGSAPARVARRDLLLMAGIGAILATHFSLWIASLKVQGESVAASVVLVTSHPLLVGLLSHFVLKERLNKWMALGIALGFTGVVVIALANYGPGGSLLGANLLAFLGGVMAGFYFLAGRRLRQRIPLLDYAFVVYASATGVLFVYALALGQSLTPVGEVRSELLLFLALAVVPQIGGHTLYNWSLRWVTAPVVSLSLVGEPIGSSLLAWLFLGQVPSAFIGFGAALALVGIYLTAWGSGSRTRDTIAARDVE